MDTERADGAGALRGRVALNRRRQRELYGCPLGDRVRRLTAALGITQARLAHTLGLSPAMLSQLASARRVKIGDPAVLARLQLLDQRCGAGAPRGAAAVDALLTEVARARLRWTADDVAAPPGRIDPDCRPDPAGPADVLRGVAPPARLAAAAAALDPGFPELARVLRQAAGGARSRPVASPPARGLPGGRSRADDTAVGPAPAGPPLARRYRDVQAAGRPDVDDW